MMEQLGTLLFMGSVAAMGILVWWAMKNDDAGDTGPTHGFMAMKDFTEPEGKGGKIRKANNASSTRLPGRRP